MLEDKRLTVIRARKSGEEKRMEQVLEYALKDRDAEFLPISGLPSRTGGFMEKDSCLQ